MYVVLNKRRYTLRIKQNISGRITHERRTMNITYYTLWRKPSTQELKLVTVKNQTAQNSLLISKTDFLLALYYEFVNSMIAQRFPPVWLSFNINTLICLEYLHWNVAGRRYGRQTCFLKHLAVVWCFLPEIFLFNAAHIPTEIAFQLALSKAM